MYLEMWQAIALLMISCFLLGVVCTLAAVWFNKHYCANQEGCEDDDPQTYDALVETC